MIVITDRLTAVVVTGTEHGIAAVVGSVVNMNGTDTAAMVGSVMNMNGVTGNEDEAKPAPTAGT